MLGYLKQFYDYLSNDKIIIGLCIIFLNIASKYIDFNLTKNQETIIKNLGKEVLVFFIAFIGTRDILVSIILTVIYWIISTWLLNENSNLCILPENLKTLHKAIDTNHDNYISQEEINHAINLLSKAKKKSNIDSSNINNYNNYIGFGLTQN
jgi:hypothetical protein